MSLQTLVAKTKADASDVPEAINALTGDDETHRRAIDLVTAVQDSARAAARAAPRGSVSLLAANAVAETAGGLLDILDEISEGSTPALLSAAKREADALVGDANHLAQESMGVGGRRKKTRKVRRKTRKTRKYTRR